MAARLESSGETDFDRDFVIIYLATIVAFFSGSQYGFVAGDKSDRLEVASCLEVAPVSQMEVEKMVECYC